jgi:septum formation topological specificity factor MinE
MPTPQHLKTMMLKYYLSMIREKKICFKDIDRFMPYGISDELLGLLVEDGRFEYRTKYYMDLKTELMVVAAKDIEIDQDMIMMNDGDSFDRELVRDITITFKEPRSMYAVVHDPDPEFIDDDDNIIMMSDTLDDFGEYLDDEANIVQIFTDTYKKINEYQHPAWERIFKHVEKRVSIYDY